MLSDIVWPGAFNTAPTQTVASAVLSDMYCILEGYAFRLHGAVPECTPARERRVGRPSAPPVGGWGDVAAQDGPRAMLCPYTAIAVPLNSAGCALALQ